MAPYLVMFFLFFVMPLLGSPFTLEVSHPLSRCELYLFAVLQELKELRNADFLGNPFCMSHDDYRLSIIYHLSRLRSLDGIVVVRWFGWKIDKQKCCLHVQSTLAAQLSQYWLLLYLTGCKPVLAAAFGWSFWQQNTTCCVEPVLRLWSH